MRIPYGFELISGGTLEVNKDEANIVSMIFEEKPQKPYRAGLLRFFAVVVK